MFIALSASITAVYFSVGIIYKNFPLVLSMQQIDTLSEKIKLR